MAAPPPELDDATLRRICEILADTGSGLTNAELDRLLHEARVADPTTRTAGPGTVVMVSKRERLNRALSARQRASDRYSSNHRLAGTRGKQQREGLDM